MKKFNFITLCSGYDSQLIAMRMFCAAHEGDSNELLAWSEIDGPACKMHDLIFPEYADRNLGDMTKIDWDKEKVERKWPEEIDLLTYSTPCTEISQAGKQQGFEKGSDTRSAILWSTEDAVRSLHPRFLLQENVFALVSKKFLPQFLDWCRVLESHGYINLLAPVMEREDGTRTKQYCMNAKDYGIPQNRERVYMVSVRKDVYEQEFKERGGFLFPMPEELGLRLEDVLEEDVDEKYFLKDEQVEKFLVTNNKDAAFFMRPMEGVNHAVAMFVKTWYHRWFCEHPCAWSVEAERLSGMVAETREVMRMEADRFFADESGMVLGKDFFDEFVYNMNRRPDEPEWWNRDQCD